MTYMTTTDLRTQTHVLVSALKKGQKVGIIHRSEIIGEFHPVTPPLKPMDIKALYKDLKGLNLPHYSDKERERIYREHLEKKYGKGIS